MVETSKAFDYTQYQIKPSLQKHKLIIDETGDEFEVTVKQLSWVKRNQLVSQCLKEMIVEAPWGATNEAFLVTIDERLGRALESLVPTAFGADEGGPTPDEIKKG